MSTHETPTLSAELREKTGSRYARRLRDEGRIPANVYGHGEANSAVHLDAHTFEALIQQSAHLINIEVGGKTEPCLIKDVQWDHLGRHVVHIDLTRVDLKEKVEVEVELEFVGEPKAAAEPGAVVNHELTSLTVACRADAIPDSIKVYTEELTADVPILVGGLLMPDGVAPVNDADQIVAAIAYVKQAEETEGSEDGAEPEVIGAKDDE